jgi:two-component system sensor histidine kinase/response regulator
LRVAPRAGRAADAPAALRAARVLVVDDDPPSRMHLAEQLHAAGADVHTAGSLASAGTRLAEGRWAAMIVDAGLAPDHPLAAVRTLRAAAPVPAVLLVSRGVPLDAADATAAGVAAVVTRPVRQSVLLDAVATAVGTSAMPAPAPASRPDGLRAELGLRVLVAEDNPVNQRLALALLAKLGCTAEAVGNGREAVAALAARPYDVVLMDCQMPEMDGYEATAAIRARERDGAHVPIVAMTANAMPGDRERCLAAGMDEYVAKPVRPDVLRDVLAGIKATRAAHGAGTPDVDGILAGTRASCDDAEVLGRVVASRSAPPAGGTD